MQNGKKNRLQQKKESKQRKGKKFLKFLRSLSILFFFFTIIGLLCAIFIFNSLKANTIEITENNFWQNQSSIEIYDANNNKIGKLSERTVDWVSICRDPKEDEEKTTKNTVQFCSSDQVSNVSSYYLNALIATEDQNFLEHNGVNFKGMIRVTLSALQNGDTSAGGGSSITMQLAKLLYLNPVMMFDEENNQLSWTRDETVLSYYDISYENKLQYKLTQMALAMKIEEKFTKEQIMENYINTMWFGDGGYGIVNASKYFYGISPAKLNISQAATLAGMTQIPMAYNPYENPELTTERRDIVISRLEAEGYITAEEAKEAKAVDITSDLVDHSKESSKEEQRIKYYNDINLYVLDELQSLLGGSLDLTAGGMEIHTTIDPQLQESTIDILDTSNQLIGYQILEGTQTGTALIDVETGGILALGNGFDGQNKFAYAWNEPHQPGSASKPLSAYSAAIEYLGWSTIHKMEDKKTYYSDGTEIRNYTRKYLGEVTMMRALSESLNTTALQAFQAVVDEIGIEGMTSWFNNIGLKIWQTADDAGENVYESYAIGAFLSTPLEMASAFATFANGGIYNEPHIIEYIKFDDKNPYYSALDEKWYPEYDSHKAMEPSTAYLITKMLNPDNKGAFTGNADVPELDMAIKTGTSNWGENPYGITEGSARDRWTVGYSPDIAAAVWYAYDSDHQKEGYEFYSQPEQPLFIFKALMRSTIGLDNEQLTNGKFVKPENVIEKEVDGTMHYFVGNTDDLEDITKTPDAPYVNISLQNKNQVDLSWDEVEDATEYDVFVNDKKVKTTSDTSVSLSYDELFAVSCSSSYVIGVQSIGEEDKESGTTSYTLTNDVSNCSTPSDSQKAAKKEE